MTTQPSDEQLEYIGPAIVDDAPKKQMTEGQIKDESQMSTLEKVQAQFHKEIADLESIRSITVSPRDGLTTEQQLAVNKELVSRLMNIQNKINKGIRDVKEHQNG